MKRSTRIGSIFVSLILGLIWAASANAVPSFARKYDMNCSGCHTAYPQLNAIGREFKETGYRFATDSDKDVNQDISDFLQLEKHIPISAVLVSRPYDKKDSGDAKVRAIHEVEIIFAGNVAKNWSGFFEMEAEDENDFEPEIGPAVLTYNYSRAFNFQAGWSPIFWADAYGILVDHFRLTRGHLGAIDQSFGGADGDSTLRALRQNIGVFGRVGAGRIFYNVNYSGDAKDAEGENASTISALVDFDITDSIMIGAFGMSGENENTGGAKRDYSRAGIQFQADIADARIQALFVTASDDLVGGIGDEDNDAFSLQGFWTFTDDTLRPTWVPLIRYDTYETNDGNDDFGELTLNLTYYFNQNIKGFVEYWDRFDAPTSAQEDDRLTIQITAAF